MVLFSNEKRASANGSFGGETGVYRAYDRDWWEETGGKRRWKGRTRREVSEEEEGQV